MSEHIICYDISDPRRLASVFRYLKKRAVPLQYSVFLLTGDDRQLKQCLTNVEKLINPKEDDLRAYTLPARGIKARLGKSALPAGIQWSGLPTAW